jgi:hypothetical protein
MKIKDAVYRYAIGKLESSTLPDIATDALIEGIESPSLAKLAGENPDAGLSELGPIFERALIELAIKLPSREQMASVTLWYFANELSRPDLDPLELVPKVRHFILDNKDLIKPEDEAEVFLIMYSELIDVEDSHDDLLHKSSEADALRQSIRHDALAYAARHKEPT